MAILNNKFAPVTFKVGFLRADIQKVIHSFLKWQHGILRIVSQNPVVGDLEAKLAQLLPLDEDGETMLFTSTRSTWVAIFDNRPEGGLSTNAVAVISEALNCEGVCVVDIPNTFSKSNPAGERGVWGAIALSTFGRQPDTGVWGVTRSISLRNDASGWKFSQMGKPLVFESVGSYEAKHTRDKFTHALLDQYLQSLEIYFEMDSFYHGAAVLTRSRSPLKFSSHRIDLAEVQKKIRVGPGFIKP